jgi:hypothetical protein
MCASANGPTSLRKTITAAIGWASRSIGTASTRAVTKGSRKFGIRQARIGEDVR